MDLNDKVSIVLRFSYKLAFFLPEKIVPMSAFDLCVCDDLPFCAMKKYRRGVHQTLCTYV